MRLILIPMAVFCGVALVSTPDTARADVDLAVVGLVGTGVDTGDAENNPYQLQLGAAGELTLNGFVLGVRGTRSIGSDESCVGCIQVHDLRTIGGDVGFDWQLLMLHLSPRFGVGRIKERGGEIVAPYLEPGGVAELEIALLTLGMEVRYRVALGESDASGLLAYLRVGLRF